MAISTYKIDKLSPSSFVSQKLLFIEMTHALSIWRETKRAVNSFQRENIVFLLLFATPSFFPEFHHLLRFKKKVFSLYVSLCAEVSAPLSKSFPEIRANAWIRSATKVTVRKVQELLPFSLHQRFTFFLF